MKKIIFFLLSLSLLLPGPALALSQTNSAATVVIGQSTLGYVPGVTNGGTANQGDISKGLIVPAGTYFDGTRLYVVDSYNNRVLIYNQIPTTNNATPDVVIGQPDVYANGANNGGIGANTLYYPTSVYATTSKLFISDTGNHRALIYNTIPTTNNASADVVIGQTNFTSKSANQGGSVGANTLSSPYDIYYDGTKLFISDTGNHRVLIYNQIPTANNVSADVVIGQSNKTTNTVNYGGRSERSLSSPKDITVTNNKLFIADYGNHRVLIYNQIPASDYAPANVVIGQTTMTAGSSSTAANRLKYASDVYSDGTKLFIADGGNNRVLIYNTIPTSNGASADVVIGQTNFTSKSANQGGSVGANTLSSPAGVYSYGTKLLVVDSDNHRALIYNTIPTTNNASADVVIGQPDFTSDYFNQGGSAGANTLSYPTGVYSDGTRLYVADSYNNRVLIYNQIPTANNVSADVVIGQTNFTSNSANQGGSAGANTLSYPTGVYSDGTRLYVADSYNNRVLIYNQIPTANNVSADVVIGQTNFTSNSANQGGSAGANTLSYPTGVYSDGTKLLVADNNNHRVLIYNQIPTANNVSADVVIGQTNFTSNSANQGGSAGANTLSSPTNVYFDGTRLFITDGGTSRVLIYNTIPTTNNASADVVIGQPDFTSSYPNQGGSLNANTLVMPMDVYSDGTKLFIADGLNFRVLIYNTIPTTNNASADVVIGQPDMTTTAIGFPIYATGSNISFATCVSYDGTRLYVCDSFFSRILVYNTLISNGANADLVIGQADFTANSADQGGNAGANTLEAFGETQLKVSITDNKLFVSDSGNSRILIYPLGPQNTTVSTPVQSSQQKINLTLVADDAKEVMISEQADFSNAIWQAYQTSMAYTFETSRTGDKIVYVKFRDYANYESAAYALSVSYSIPGGGGLPPGFNSPPALPAAGSGNGSSGFGININNQALTTEFRTVKLTFAVGSDTTRVALSEDPDFYLSPLQDLKPEMDFLLSPGDGLKTIYAKFYTQYGYASNPVSATITLNTSASPTVQSPEPTPTVGTGYVAKLIKYPGSPTVYWINPDNQKQPFYNALAFTEKGHQWSAIETVKPENTWPTGAMLYPSGYTVPVTLAWSVPAGYEYIASPSHFDNYTNIITEPNSPRKYGLPKATISNTYQFKNYLYYGLKDNKEVKLLQALLKTKGYLTKVNWPGTYDAATVKAVRSLQKEYNITPNTGNVGPKTRAVLNGMR